MGGASFLQSAGSHMVKLIKKALAHTQIVTGEDKKMVEAFLQGGENAPGSGEILGMLKSMKDELSRDIASLTKDEEAAVAGFTSMKASKEKEIEFADESIESKKERIGALAVSVVQLKDVIEDSAKEAEDAKKFAATLEKQCAEKKKEWDARCKMRSDEMAAIGEAISILSDDDALDVFKKTLPAAELVQDSYAPVGFRHHKNMFTGEMSFLQKTVKPASGLSKALAVLSSPALNNKVRPMGLMLFTLKSKLRAANKDTLAGAVDFSAIFKMIDEMIVVLTKENKDDAAQKDFCVAELDKTEREKEAVDDKMAQITSTLEETGGEIEELEAEIKTLQEGIAALDKDVAEATAQRKTEHEDYGVNLQMNELAIEIIGKAKNRLQKFYNPSLYKAPPKKEMSMEEKIIAGGASALVQAEASFDHDSMSFV